MRNVWKNAGAKWYERKWETTVGNVHLHGWTQRGTHRKAERLERRIVTWRV